MCKTPSGLDSIPPCFRLLHSSQDDEKLLEVVEARARRGEGPCEIDWEAVSSAFDDRTAAQCEARCVKACWCM